MQPVVSPKEKRGADLHTAIYYGPDGAHTCSRPVHIEEPAQRMHVECGRSTDRPSVRPASKLLGRTQIDTDLAPSYSPVPTSHYYPVLQRVETLAIASRVRACLWCVAVRVGHGFVVLS